MSGFFFVPAKSLLARFMGKVEKRENRCWEWVGATDTSGYGQFRLKGRNWQAHRLAYIWKFGKLPNFVYGGLELDHLCRNRACVNPEHLELVAHHVNILRGNAGANNSRKIHCPRGHPYNLKNTIITKTERRVCRICRKDTDKRFREKNHERYNKYMREWMRKRYKRK